jgi:hypothetical protein
MAATGRAVAASNVAAAVAGMDRIGADAALMGTDPAPACADPRGEWRKMTVALLREAAQSAGVGLSDVAAINRAGRYADRFTADTRAMIAELKGEGLIPG